MIGQNHKSIENSKKSKRGELVEVMCSSKLEFRSEI
jgi:hypothetical protein